MHNNKDIVTEYQNNQDEFSKEIILTHLDALLKYANRYYTRQFLYRKEINKTLFTSFKEIFDAYFESNQLEEKGSPVANNVYSACGFQQFSSVCCS